jgi:hypothetical protein
MSTAPLKNVVLALMAELLRPVGFRKAGSLFTRALPTVFHLISLQSSTSSTASSLRVTVNIAVWVPSLAEATQRPDVSSSHWRQRIGTLMPEHSDRWWTVTTKREAPSAAADMIAAVQQFALPALAALETSAALADLWESGASPGLTEFQAQRYLHRLHEKSKIG